MRGLLFVYIIWAILLIVKLFSRTVSSSCGGKQRSGWKEPKALRAPKDASTLAKDVCCISKAELQSAENRINLPIYIVVILIPTFAAEQGSPILFFVS